MPLVQLALNVEDIVPHPVRRLLIGGKRLVRAVEYAHGDQHVRAASKQIIGPEPLDFIMGTKPSRTRLARCSAEPRLTLYFLMLANIALPSRSASQGTAFTP